MKKVLPLSLFLLLILSVSSIFAVTVQIDQNQTFQTIEGMGAYNFGPHAADAATDLGATMMRIQLKWDNTVHPSWATINTAKNAGIKRFIMSIWTPPTYMKEEGPDQLQKFKGTCTDGAKAICGGRLIPSKYGEFSDYLIDFIKKFKTQTGLDLYAISPQNELRLQQTYASCVYSYDEFRDLIKVLGPKMDAAGVGSTKIFGPEDVNSMVTTGNFMSALYRDPLAKQHIDVFAVHGYGTGGVVPSANNWGQLKTIGDLFPIPLWMTETSGYTNSWSGDGAFGIAANIFGAIKFGHLAAWVWWRGYNEQSWMAENKCLIYNGKKTKKYYAHKIFYRHLKPGAVMVAAETGREDVNAVAFVHPENEQLIVIIINSTNGSQSVTLAGNNVPQSFTSYMTNGGQDYGSGPNVSGGSLSVPASSIVTLVANNHNVTAVKSTIEQKQAFKSLKSNFAIPHSGAYTVDLSGRKAPARNMQNLKSGIYLQYNQNGSAVGIYLNK